MKFVLFVFSALITFGAFADSSSCPQDSVQVGYMCVDVYEASMWETTDAKTIRFIRTGRIESEADLIGKAARRGDGIDDYGAGCPTSGNGCKDFYAVSIPGVNPSTYLNWFQALAGCRNAGKLLLDNMTWQAAALGTPDTGGSDNGATTCNTDDLVPGLSPTGSRSGCVSDVGAYDMVGNVWEMVADWVPKTAGWTTWESWFSDDYMGMRGADFSATWPGVLHRGGNYGNATWAGVYAVNAHSPPWVKGDNIGFRCGRPLVMTEDY